MEGLGNATYVFSQGHLSYILWLPHPQNGYRGAYDRVTIGPPGLEGGERGGMGTENLQWRQLAIRRTGAEI